MQQRRINAILILAAVVLLLLNGLRGVPDPDNGAATPALVVDDSSIPQEFPVVFSGPVDLAGCVKWCWFARDSPSAVVLHTDGSGPDNDLSYHGWPIRSKPWVPGAVRHLPDGSRAQ